MAALRFALVMLCLQTGSSFLLTSILPLGRATGASHPPPRFPSAWAHRSLPIQGRPGTGRLQGAGVVAMRTEGGVFTCEEVEEAANQCGMTISINFLGPYYRAVIRTLPSPGQEKGKAVGFTTGTMLFDLLRQDTMRVSSVNNGNLVSRERLRKLKAERDWRMPTVYGVSLVLGAYVVAHAYGSGCTRAELLAIKDDDRQHAVLVRHYRRLGLEVIKILNNDIDCVPDRLIWGGEGTLMGGDIRNMMEKHTAEIDRLRGVVQSQSD